MELNWTKDPETGRKKIMIEVEASDDPQEWIEALLHRGTLEVALKALGNPRSTDWCPTDNHALFALQQMVWFHQLVTDRLEGLTISARDAWGYSWGTIGNALGTPRHTARSRVETARIEHANRGWTYTRDT